MPLAGARLVAFAATCDLDASHAFYGTVLGLARVDATPFANVYDAGGSELRVTRVERVAAAPYTVLGWSVPDLGATVDALRARGVAFHRFGGLEQDSDDAWTAPGGARIAWFGDPDANTLSLTQPAPA